MKLYSESNRSGIAWFSNTVEKTPLISVGLSGCVIRAYVVWAATDSEHTLLIRTSSEELQVTASSHFHDRTSGLFMFNHEITSFVTCNQNTTYEIQPIESEEEPFRWHLIVVQRCPTLPVRHVYVQIQENEEEPSWETMQSNLPSITAHLNQTAQLYLLGYGQNSADVAFSNLQHEQHDLHVTLSGDQILHSNYHHLEEKCPHPFILAQQCPLPMTDMHLEQTTDRVHVCMHDVVMTSTKITNTGQTAALYVQYRTTLPSCMRLVENSFTINDIPVPVSTDNHHVITVILRDMPVGDLLLVSFQMHVYAQPAGTYDFSSVLDYHFYAEPHTLSIGNTGSNTIEYTSNI